MPTCRDCRKDYIGHDLTVRCPDCAKRVVDADRARIHELADKVANKRDRGAAA